VWIVHLALRRPYTFVVAALAILLATPLVLRNAPVDIFPNIDIPVISVIWSYNGLTAKEMADRVVTPVERNLAVQVTDIEHIESQSVGGMGVIKLFLQPRADVQTTYAQVVAASQTALRSLPAGATAPLVIKYSASNLPVLQIGLSSPTLSDTEMTDLAITVLRTRFNTVPGAIVPYPFGGKLRQVSVDLDGLALLAKGLTPVDVVNAVSAQNLILPTGTAKIGGNEYNVALNGAVATLAQLNDIPLRSTDGTTIFLGDVAQVHDGFVPQTNIVRRDGERGLLMSVMKNGSASTLDVVNGVLAALPSAAQQVPPDLAMTPMFDQSRFVRAAIHNVVVEAVVAAALTATMILLFLGNWRSTCIIALSIPLSILSSIIALRLMGETINLMTLGGLALAVGILVDDATVTIENIERHLHSGTSLHAAILDGAGEIAVPAFVSTLCICIVFVPMFFLTGVARYLFVPMAEAVVLAMLASYVISRTLVPTLVYFLMGRNSGRGMSGGGALHRLHRRFNRLFERLRKGYVEILAALLARRRAFGLAFLGFCLTSSGLFWVVGRDFFPEVDAGLIRLHIRAPSGTRIEAMPRLVDDVEAIIRELIPERDRGTILDNLGGPYTPINTTYNNSGVIDTSDAEILVSLKPGHHDGADYVASLRSRLQRDLPDLEFYFQPADLVSQTINFGLPAPIDIQFLGAKLEDNLRLAAALTRDLRQIPGLVDAHVYQRFNRPALSLQMDRLRLQQLGLSPRDVAQNLLIALSSSFQTAPTFWLNPANGVSYSVSVQTRQHEVDSIESLMRIPVANASTVEPQLLGNLVSLSRTAEPSVVSRYNISPVVNIHANVQGRELGAVAKAIQERTDALRPQLPRGSEIVLRGQVETMQTSFSGLASGLAMAVVLVYLLMVVNFQSWIDPLIIIGALPGALAGIAWALFLTGTTLNVPSLTGAIMTVGVATANSILVVSFARSRLAAGVPAAMAALEAGATRLRPVLMTAAAMVIGMLPMAFGAGEGGEQNAPLGRAVIGGLLFATLSTLWFVPLVFAGFHGFRSRRVRGNAAGALTPGVRHELA
jgi:multidrug efflux pump subunit AcrB